LGEQFAVAERSFLKDGSYAAVEPKAFLCTQVFGRYDNERYRPLCWILPEFLYELYGS
jgi:hypothetical protein